MFGGLRGSCTSFVDTRGLCCATLEGDRRRVVEAEVVDLHAGLMAETNSRLLKLVGALVPLARS